MVEQFRYRENSSSQSNIDDFIRRVDGGDFRIIDLENVNELINRSGFTQVEKGRASMVAFMKYGWVQEENNVRALAVLLQQVSSGQITLRNVKFNLDSSDLTPLQRKEITEFTEEIDGLKVELNKIKFLGKLYDLLDDGKLTKNKLKSLVSDAEVSAGQAREIMAELDPLISKREEIEKEQGVLAKFIEFFERILNGQLNKRQLIDALKDTNFSKVQKEELTTIAEDVEKLPNGFKELLLGSYRDDFLNLEMSVNALPVRDASDARDQSDLKGFISRAVPRFRRYKTEKDINELILNRQVDEVFKSIPQLPNIRENDRALITKLTKLGFELRQEQAQKGVYLALSQEEVNFDKVLSQIKNFPPDENQDQDQFKIKELTSLVLNLAKRTNIKNILRVLSPINADLDQVLSAIDQLPNRCVDDLDLKVMLKEKVRMLFRERKKVFIREQYVKKDAIFVLSEIEALPDEGPLDLELKQKISEEYKKFIRYRKNLRPEDYDVVFSKEIDELLKSLRESKFKIERFGKNLEAFRYLKRKYRETLYALVETYREDPETREEMERVVPKFKLANSPAFEYRRRVRDLLKERELTEIERAYFESIESLTLFAPYLVAGALADVGTTSVFLQSHFETLSQKTIDSIKDGNYFPLIQIGTGPNGMIAIGEIVRKNPKLASQMLVVDQGPQPGGPFAIPNGPAWNLNSANLVGEKSLPDKPDADEEKTVRVYGSPERWYPGERKKNRRDTRAGSINKLIDYFPDADDLSNKRYPSNEELQISLALQAALTIDKLALKTRVIKREPYQTDVNPERKLITLSIENDDGTKRIVKVITDNFIASPGLGDPTYGFPLEGKRAEKVLEAIKDQEGFKKVEVTLGAFKGISDRTAKKPTVGLGKNIGIQGIGNSSDTLLEIFGRQFETENPSVKNVEKVYVIATGVASKRARYAQLNDLRARIGKGNIITSIRSRVGDFDFDDYSLPLSQRKIVLYNTDDQLITDEEGEVIKLDNFVSASGFRSSLNQVIEGGGKRVPLTLPTNPAVAVAEVLDNDPGTLIIGTASSPKFNDEKLSQLPKTSRDDLVSVGAENAVAIGFRGPDTQAAVNIFLQTREFKLEDDDESQERKELVEVSNPKSGVFYADPYASESKMEINGNDLRIQDNADRKRFLSARLGQLLSYLEVKKEGQDFSGRYQFKLAYYERDDEFYLAPIFEKGDVDNPPISFLNFVLKRLRDGYFQRYALSLLKSTRGRDPYLTINLGFKRGRVDIANTYIP